MENAFFAASKKIANAFLQSVVFIDDKAFPDNPEDVGEHDFDAYAVTKAFALHQKICAIYKPKTEEDIDNLAQLAKKADITVLDWQIDLTPAIPNKESEEEDDVSEDIRGLHTLRIIREILIDPTSAQGGLKLILVYTGTSNLDGIAEVIHKSLEAEGLSLKKDFCEVCADNIKIIVIAKADQALVAEGRQADQFQHNQDLRSRVISYEQLPNYIIDRFARITTGLLPNFVLTALTLIRENTFKLVNLYNKDLDVAFLAHRLLLSDQDDSKDLLLEMFSHSIHGLLAYNSIDKTVDRTEVLSWLDNYTSTAQIKIAGKQVTIDNAFLKSWVKDGFVNSLSEFWVANGFGPVEDKQKDLFEKGLRNLKAYFLTGDQDNKQDRDFSILSHHKSIFKPSPISPRLTLGTVIKGLKSDTYWVCIQQRCDSVRIVEQRRFLFLPLDVIPPESDAPYHFITERGVRLKLHKKPFQLRTIKFYPETGDNVIKATKAGNSYVFTPYYTAGRKDSSGALEYQSEKDETYEWVFDLKDLHAQRIVTEFVSELSRVGLDEAEWLRRGYTR
jgi:hypothetical protein